MNLNGEKMRGQIAALESKVDLLESELTNLDELLRECGFPNGISTLKSTVEDLINESRSNNEFFRGLDI